MITDADMDMVMKKVKVGQKIREYYNKGNRNNQLYHIRAIVDDDYVVMRFWGKRKIYWHYVIKSAAWFAVAEEMGHIQWDVK